MGEVLCIIQVDKNMMDNGRRGLDMELELFIIQVELNMILDGIMIKSLEDLL